MGSDFAVCEGKDCAKKSACRRHEAYKHASKKQLRWYVIAKSCIDSYYSAFLPAKGLKYVPYY